jgi:hypothetical protein
MGPGFTTPDAISAYYGEKTSEITDVLGLANYPTYLIGAPWQQHGEATHTVKRNLTNKQAIRVLMRCSLLPPFFMLGSYFRPLRD